MNDPEKTEPQMIIGTSTAKKKKSTNQDSEDIPVIKKRKVNED